MNEKKDSQISSSPENTNSFWGWIIGAVCILFTLFQIYTAGFGQFPDLIQRSIHGCFALVLSFLILPTFKNKPTKGQPSLINTILAVLSATLCLYIVFNYDRLMETVGMEAADYEMVMGGIMILIILEAARRATGVILPLMAIGSIGYAILGGYIPGYWGHGGLNIRYVIEYLYLGPEGLWGVVTGVSATLVAAFIIFGAILMTTGGAASFMQVALLVGGRTYGGAAKVATVASALFGMLSGSAIANVATTGNFTIPMMKRLGYKAHFAGGVEATASSGGQITPPIMGAGAFIMSELIDVPYLKIAAAATLPALLFFICVWMSIDLEAHKVNLKRVSPEEIPRARKVFNWSTSGPVCVTVIVLLVSMLMGHTPTLAAFLAIATNVGLYLFVNPMSGSQFLKRCGILMKGVEKAGRGMVTVVSLLICAQVTISMISLSGLGIKMSEMIIGASAGHLFLALVLAAVVSLILGMGMPTTAAYILAASVVGPALNMMGINRLSAHMFIFYWALLSGLTPPVCVAVFTAATIAEAKWLKVAGVSVRLAIMKYILPFFFIYRPAILLMDRWYNIVETFIVTCISSILIAIGTIGFYRRPISLTLRAIIFAAALSLMVPGKISDIIGVISVVSLIILDRIQRRRGPIPANN